MKKTILLASTLFAAFSAICQNQPDYIPEQLGRDAHHIIQSLGAFVGNERAESQSFDITYMPAGNGVDGVMIINTADYRCTFNIDKQYDQCRTLTIDIRSQDFLSNFYLLFSVYPTENRDGHRLMQFGNDKIRITENPSTTTRYRSFQLSLSD